MIKKRSFLYLLLTLLSSVVALQAESVSSSAPQISFLTYTPSDKVHAMYGHTAIRVYNPVTSQDWLFNYGLFDFSSDNFLYHFVKGETDYKLIVYDTSYLQAEAAQTGISVYEQVLNLTDDESVHLCSLLLDNARPENATYRYSFIFDNCSTRPLMMLRKCLPDSVVSFPTEQFIAGTFRKQIHHCVGAAQWIEFGIDLVLGGRIDYPMTVEEPLFLPKNLQEFLSRTTVLRNGQRQPLCKSEGWFIQNSPLSVVSTPFPIRPTTIFFLILVAAFLLTVVDWRRQKHSLWFDELLFIVTGLTGCVVFFLTFFSEHPAVSPNWVALWISPCYLLFAALLPFFRRRVAFGVGLIIFVLSVSFFTIAPFTIQVFPLSLYLIVLILLVRALFFIFYYRSKRV